MDVAESSSRDVSCCFLRRNDFLGVLNWEDCDVLSLPVLFGPEVNPLSAGFGSLLEVHIICNNEREGNATKAESLSFIALLSFLGSAVR